MIVIEQKFIDYLHSLKQELYTDPTKFIPKYNYGNKSYDHEYYMKNKDKIREYQRRYNSKPEVRAKIIARAKVWARTHPEQVKAKRKAYEARNRDKINARCRERYWRLKGIKQ